MHWWIIEMFFRGETRDTEGIPVVFNIYSLYPEVDGKIKLTRGSRKVCSVGNTFICVYCKQWHTLVLETLACSRIGIIVLDLSWKHCLIHVLDTLAYTCFGKIGFHLSCRHWLTLVLETGLRMYWKHWLTFVLETLAYTCHSRHFESWNRNSHLVYLYVKHWQRIPNAFCLSFHVNLNSILYSSFTFAMDFFKYTHTNIVEMQLIKFCFINNKQVWF